MKNVKIVKARFIFLLGDNKLLSKTKPSFGPGKSSIGALYHRLSTKHLTTLSEKITHSGSGILAIAFDTVDHSNLIRITSIIL